MKALLVLFAAVAAIGLSVSLPNPSAQACGIAGPFDFDTYEAEDYVNVYARAIELVTSGTAITSTFTVGEAGEVVDLRYQGVESGPRASRAATTLALTTR